MFPSRQRVRSMVCMGRLRGVDEVRDELCTSKPKGPTSELESVCLEYRRWDRSPWYESRRAASTGIYIAR